MGNPMATTLRGVKDQGLRHDDLPWWKGVDEEMANQYGGRRTQVNYTIRSACSGLIGYIIWWPRNCSRLRYWQIDSCAAPGHHFSCRGNNLAGTPVRRRKWIETQRSWAHWEHPPLACYDLASLRLGFASFIAAGQLASGIWNFAHWFWWNTKTKAKTN